MSIVVRSPCSRGPRNAFAAVSLAIALTGAPAFASDGPTGSGRAGPPDPVPAPAAALPVPDAASDRAALDALVGASRIEPQTVRSMARLRDGLRAQMTSEALAGQFERERLPRLERLIDEVYTADVLQASIEEALAADLQPGDVEAVLSYTLSPLGQRALDSEDARTKDDGQAAFDRFAQSFGTRPDGEARLDRAATLERTIGFAEVQGGFAIDMQRAMLGGLAVSLPPEARDPIERVMIALEERRAGVAEELRESMTLYLAFVYQGLTLDELDAMNDHASTAAAGRYTAALVRGTSEGLQRASIEFGDRLGRTMSLASIGEEI